MISFEELSPAQGRWLALVKHYFADVHSSGIITYKQLIAADEKFRELRATDPKFKVGWPIWLITNNQTSRGLYQLPVESETSEVTIDDDVKHPFYEEYVDELKRFNVIE
jgi:hypothetical protein